MVIDKSTSNALLVNSLRVFGSSGKPLRKVKLFNTDTLVATKDDDSTDTCVDFGFFIAFSDEAAVQALLDASLHTKIVLGGETGHGGSASMVYTAEDTEYLLLINNFARPALCECSNCGKKFVVFVDRSGELWSST